MKRRMRDMQRRSCSFAIVPSIRNRTKRFSDIPQFGRRAPNLCYSRRTSKARRILSPGRKIAPDSMLHEAVSHYHDLLTKDDLAQSSRRCSMRGWSARSSSSEAAAFAISAPAFRHGNGFRAHHRHLRDGLGRDSESQRRGDRRRALLDELGMTEIERELVRIDPGYSEVSPTARLDSFLTERLTALSSSTAKAPPG